jgi:septum formation protein
VINVPAKNRRRLVLASASPARLRSLAAAGIGAQVIVSGVDESTVDVARADVLCLTLARLKAQAVADRLRHTGRPTRLPWERPTGPPPGQPTGPPPGQPAEGALVLGCDSVLALDDQVLGKPADAADAVRRWRRMRGAAGVLHTGHCVIEVTSGKQAEAVAASTVHFADLTDAEIDAYVATGEPLNVAGAFTIDGFGAPFVERIDGDPGTVIGLSLPLLRHLLADLGIAITDLWEGD